MELVTFWLEDNHQDNKKTIHHLGVSSCSRATKDEHFNIF